jgi:polypyrimidine tract-binding protein 1
LFSQYGEVQRVLIFEKAKVWKTFVEMHNPEGAQLAWQHLNNQAIFPDGSKMNIFSSNLRQISFQNYNLGGVDYSALKKAGSVQEVEQEKQPVRGRSQTHWAHHIFDE